MAAQIKSCSGDDGVFFRSEEDMFEKPADIPKAVTPLRDPGRPSRPSIESLPSDDRLLSLAVPAELLRMVRLQHVLANFGQVMGGLSLSDGENALELFSLSEEAESLDDFLSHSWETPRWLKTLTLLFVYNSRPAVIASLVALLLLEILECTNVFRRDDFTFTVHVGDFDSRMASVDTAQAVRGMMIPPAVFVVFLVGWQRIRQVLNLPMSKVFLDKICIHQTDEDKKTQAVLGLAGFLKVTNRLVILWSPRYLTRLWCIYELASWAYLGKDFETQVLLAPVNMTVAVLITMIGIWLAFLLNALTEIKQYWMLVVVVTILCSTICLQRVLSDFKKLRQKLENFEVRKAECWCCAMRHKGANGSILPCDRRLVYHTLEGWFADVSLGLPDSEEAGEAHLDRFDHFVRSRVAPTLGRVTFGRRALFKLCLLVMIAAVWNGVSFAVGGTGPLLQLGDRNHAGRSIVSQLLPALVDYPCVPMFALRSLALCDRVLEGQVVSLALCDRVLEGQVVSSKVGRSLVTAGRILLPAVIASGAMAMPTILSELTFELESPAPFAIAHSLWAVLCISTFLPPWQP